MASTTNAIATADSTIAMQLIKFDGIAIIAVKKQSDSRKPAQLIEQLQQSLLCSSFAGCTCHSCDYCWLDSY